MSYIVSFFTSIFTFPIYNMLTVLDHLFGDFGLSIIMLTLMIRICIIPLTLKQLRSNKATQSIQPLVTEIRKKYADDYRAQHEAIQQLYKEYRIKPMGGCLPVLLQMPILYGIYSAMRIVLTPVHPLTLSDINQHIYSFLPSFTAMPNFDLTWFTFLNTAWHIPLTVADPSHILPILAALATFIYLRMSQSRLASGQKSGMTQQMQIMSCVMPIITLLITWHLPAGLALYWTTSSAFSVIQQYYVTGWGSLFCIPALSKKPGQVLS